MSLHTQSTPINMGRTEKHHVIPVCMEGHDIDENIILLSKNDHDLVHRTQNIPYSNVRWFRLKTNHMVDKSSVEYVKNLRILHLKYFKQVFKLPKYLYYKQLNSIRRQAKSINKSNKVYLKQPNENANLFVWLRFYHNVLTKRNWYERPKKSNRRSKIFSAVRYQQALWDSKNIWRFKPWHAKPP